MRKNKWLTLHGWGMYVLIFSSILIILINVAVSSFSGKWMADESASVKHSNDVVTHTTGLLMALEKAETGQRAFLSTSQEDALEPFREGSAQIRQHLDRLWKLTQENPAQQEKLKQLARLLAEKQEALEQGITSRRSYSFDTALFLAQPRSDKVTTNQIVELVKQLEENEGTLLAKQQEVLGTYTSWAKAFTYLVTGFNVLMLLVVLRVIHRQKIAQEKLHLHLEQSNKQWLLDTGETLMATDKNKAAGHLVQNLQKATAFIKEIGKGNFEAKLAGVSEANLELNQDNLAGELLKMQAQMRMVAEEEARRKWTTEGLARFSDILRMNNASITGLCEVLLSELVRYLRANQGGVFIVREGVTAPCLELIACYAYERKKYLQKEIEVGEGLVGQAYLEKDIIHLTEIPDQYIAITSGLGLATPTSLLIVPLLFNEQVVGVLELASFQKFAPYEVDFIQRLAESIASAISTVQTTESTQRLLQEAQTMTEMLRAQEEEMRQNVEEMQTTHEVMSRKEHEHLEEIDRLNKLHEETLESIKKKSEEYEMLSLVANNTDNSVVITDVEGLIEFVNPGFTRLTGYTLDDAKGRKPGSFLQGPGTNQETVHRIREHLQKQESFYEEILNYNKEGNSYWISLAINPVFDEMGQLRKFISVQSNITHIKKAALDYTSQLQAIHLAYAVVEFDTKGLIINANENFLRLMGYRKEELEGQHHRLFVSEPEQASVDYQQFWQRLEEGNFVSGEFCRRTKSGEEVWVKGTYNSIRGVNGVPYKVVKYVQDITQQKQLEQESQQLAEELRQSMEEMQATIEAVEAERFKSRATLDGCVDPVITITQRGIIEYINPAAEKLWGYEAHEVIGQNVKLLMPAHYAHEHDSYLHNYADTGEAKVIGKGREVQLQRKDGSQIDILLTLSEAKLPAGTVYTAFIKDIREQKRNQEKLRQASLEMSGQVAAIDRTLATIEFSLDGTILSVNDQFLKLMDYRLEEVLGKPHRLFVEATYAQSPAYLKFWDDLSLGKAQVGEFKRLDKHNREIWLSASYTPVLGMDGKPYKVIKFAIDITEQKMTSMDHQRQIEAIYRSSAIIEFDLKGNVLIANENLLALFKYGINEIQGRHHRLFVTEEEQQSAAYKAFWQRLQAGEFITGEFERVDKNGQRIWIKGSYNPILDFNGNPYKVVKFAQDITAQKQNELLAEELATGFSVSSKPGANGSHHSNGRKKGDV